MKSTFVLLFAIATPVFAGSRTSANYSITTEASDSGGTAATSPSYSQSGSIGGIAGVSNATLPLETARHGYLGQLYEIVSLQLAASPTTLNETETRQLTANLFLDDATTLFVAHASVNWSLVSGPLQPTVTNGLVSAKAVYQDTAATVQGTYGSRSASIALTVLDNLPDNYGSYAGDGITDSWQFQYFGLNNPLAAPQADPDADGQNNLYEFISGAEVFGMLAACQIAGIECDKTVTCTVRRFLIFFSCGSRQGNNRREKTQQLEAAG